MRKRYARSTQQAVLDVYLTHISLASFLWDPDLTTQNAVSVC